jgi:hypothetical protein
MKKTILMLLFSVGFAYAQNNSLPYNQLMVNGVSLNLSKTQLLSSLSISGLPDDYYNEMTGLTYDEYQSGGNSFYFQGNDLVDFTLKDNTFSFMNNSLKVGANISVVSSLYPISFANKEVKSGLGFIIINLTSNAGTALDDFVVINYNSSNVITSIHLGEY